MASHKNKFAVQRQSPTTLRSIIGNSGNTSHTLASSWCTIYDIQLSKASWKERKLFLTRFTAAGLFTTTHVVSETSIDIPGTIFIMLNESPARLFMALRNVLDCSYDETIFTVTLLQRTRPFHRHLLCTR